MNSARFGVDKATLARTLAGGFAGFALFELWSGWLSPALLGFALSPLPLVKGVLGLQSDALAYALHAFTGVVVYALVYRLVLRPLLPGPWLVPALVLGVATWALALGVFAPQVGAPVMMNFNAMAWGSLAGHVLLALGIGAVTAWGPRAVRPLARAVA
jgi:hypothetical protein